MFSVEDKYNNPEFASIQREALRIRYNSLVEYHAKKNIAPDGNSKPLDSNYCVANYARTDSWERPFAGISLINDVGFVQMDIWFDIPNHGILVAPTVYASGADGRVRGQGRYAIMQTERMIERISALREKNIICYVEPNYFSRELLDSFTPVDAEMANSWKRNLRLHTPCKRYESLHEKMLAQPHFVRTYNSKQIIDCGAEANNIIDFVDEKILYYLE